MGGASPSLNCPHMYPVFFRVCTPGFFFNTSPTLVAATMSTSVPKVIGPLQQFCKFNKVAIFNGVVKFKLRVLPFHVHTHYKMRLCGQ